MEKQTGPARPTQMAQAVGIVSDLATSCAIRGDEGGKNQRWSVGEAVAGDTISLDTNDLIDVLVRPRHGQRPVASGLPLRGDQAGPAGDHHAPPGTGARIKVVGLIDHDLVQRRVAGQRRPGMGTDDDRVAVDEMIHRTDDRQRLPGEPDPPPSIFSADPPADGTGWSCRSWSEAGAVDGLTLVARRPLSSKYRAVHFGHNYRLGRAAEACRVSAPELTCRWVS